ncbi:MAG TPA: hypothetical protein VD927_06660 [Chryseosolibacter sp.]|nr:hypothetical protein [Chryseosolibacter sp.]
MGSYVLINPPSELPVTLDDLVAVHLKVDDTDPEAGLITEYMNAATELVQDCIQRQLMQATFEYRMKDWNETAASMYKPSGYLKLDKAPLVTVGSVKYDDTDNVEQTLSTSDYQVDTTSVPGMIRFIGNLPAVYDKPNAIRIRFVAGYGSALDSASAQRTAITSYGASRAKIAILRATADFYEQRTDESNKAKYKLNNSVEKLLIPLKLY